MDRMIFGVIIIFFAFVGVVDLCVGIGRWLRRTGGLSPAVLVLQMDPSERAAEARLMQAVDAVEQGTGLEGIRLVVLCGGGGENEAICSRFCAHRNIPVAGSWEEIPGKL